MTVAILPVLAAASHQAPHPDTLEWTMTRGTGPGGQHRNKTDSCVQLTHRPTGLQVRCDGGRSQHQNRSTALALLTAYLVASADAASHAHRNAARVAQLGSGQRGDKVRTIRCQDGVVLDHQSGQKWPFEMYRRGAWPLTHGGAA